MVHVWITVTHTIHNKYSQQVTENTLVPILSISNMASTPCKSYIGPVVSMVDYVLVWNLSLKLGYIGFACPRQRQVQQYT